MFLTRHSRGPLGLSSIKLHPIDPYQIDLTKLMDLAAVLNCLPTSSETELVVASTFKQLSLLFCISISVFVEPNEEIEINDMARKVIVADVLLNFICINFLFCLNFLKFCFDKFQG